MKRTKKQIEKPKKQKNVETPAGLATLLQEYQKKIIQLDFKIARLRDLLSRKSVERLKKSKFEKMKRQLTDAEQEYSFSQLALDQISFRMSQIS